MLGVGSDERPPDAHGQPEPGRLTQRAHGDARRNDPPASIFDSGCRFWAAIVDKIASTLRGR